jgi:hypothetical protein
MTDYSAGKIWARIEMPARYVGITNCHIWDKTHTDLNGVTIRLNKFDDEQCTVLATVPVDAPPTSTASEVLDAAEDPVNVALVNLSDNGVITVEPRFEDLEMIGLDYTAAKAVKLIQLIESVADELHGAIGAARDMVDATLVENAERNVYTVSEQVTEALRKRAVECDSKAKA